MKHIPLICLTLLFTPLGKTHAQQFPSRESSTTSHLADFLGDPVFSPIQKLWEGRGGWGGILTAKDGTLVAFQSPGGNKCRRSLDGGLTWDPDIEIGPNANYGNALVDEIKGDLLYVNPGAGWLFRSRDHGASWIRETVKVLPDEFGLIPENQESVAAMQPGITLVFGENKGRLIMPARIFGPGNSNAVEWRPYHYSNAIYSDDGGALWKTSAPFPVLGTGEGALVELSNGKILYNSREHMSRGNRFFAWSHEGGHLWVDAFRSPSLPDGARGTSYGCMGGMIRLPVEGYDILIYSNLDTDAGKMPSQVGASTIIGREKITVWVSFDQGSTWPLKRLIYKGPSAYSSLGVGRTGTPSQGRIQLLFEGGVTDYKEVSTDGKNHLIVAGKNDVQIVSFNLSWLLNGRHLRNFLKDQ